jgi:hypothetical protein
MLCYAFSSCLLAATLVFSAVAFGQGPGQREHLLPGPGKGPGPLPGQKQPQAPVPDQKQAPGQESGQEKEQAKPAAPAKPPAQPPAQGKDVDDERPCVFTVDVPGGGTSKREALCPNHYGTGKVWVITGVGCWSSTGQVSVLPQLSGFGPGSIIPEPLQCGNHSHVGRETPGTPTVYPFALDAATCRTPPCTLELTVITPDNSGPHQAVVSISGIVKKAPR